jgi:hypothetical protein
VPSHNEPATPYFLNQLHCYDQISVMQRTLMDVCDSVRELKESKQAAALRRPLFFAQDINRFLPGRRSGFAAISDRLWTYGKLIGAERELQEIGGAQSGVIRLAEFLRNGYKSVIMSSRALKIYIDHKNGAQVYALDYLERSFNACAAYNPATRARPNVIAPRESRLGFGDRIFTEPPSCDAYIKGIAKDRSNFSDSAFEYIFKNSPSGVKVLLNCNGGFTEDNGRNCPLAMDKVFGLEKDGAALSYSYKLGNTSLTDYKFTLGIELPLALPGVPDGSARFTCGRDKSVIASDKPIIIDEATEWEIEDDEAGVRMEFVTQKKVSVWLFSPDTPAAHTPPEGGRRTNGTTLFMSCPFEIESNGALVFTGRISFRKLKPKGAYHDSF